jgi:hypothetical protein
VERFDMIRHAKGFGALALAALGCESIAGVDVSYRGLDAASSADVAAPDAGEDASASVDAPVDHGGTLLPEASTEFDAAGIDSATTVEGGKCGCDATQGEGCCVPPGGAAPFCTTSQLQCPGIYLGCVADDPTGDSVCCWNGTGAGAYTSFAATCGSRPTACQGNGDCGGSGCAVVSCSGVTLGICGPAAPACP